MKTELEILKNAITMLKEKAPEDDCFYGDILWGDLHKLFNDMLPKMTPDDIFNVYGDQIALWASDYYRISNWRSKYFEKLLDYLRDVKIMYHLCEVS